MRYLKYAALSLAALVALFFLIGLFLPSSAHVERTTVIARPAVQVFTVLDSYRLFNSWSPWAAMDPQAKYTFEGPDSGAGAKLSWVGNDAVGSGSQTILESRPNELVRTQLDFGDQGSAVATFRLQPEAGGTRVTWGFDAPFGWNIPSRWFGLLFDRFIGPDYERGLSNLKTLVETFPEADWTGMEIGLVDVAPVDLIALHCTAPMDTAEIGRVMGAAYGQIAAAMQANKLDFIAPVQAITNSVTESSWDFDAAIPVAAPPAALTGELKAIRGYGGRAVKGVHVGPYDTIDQSARKVAAWVAAHGLEKSGSEFEEYVSDPGNTPPDRLITNIYVPVR